MKLDQKLIGYINLFENKTHARVKDCFANKNNTLIFVVQPGDGFKAIGKGGFIIKKLSELYKRKLKIIEFNPNVLIFVKNVIYPLKIKDINLNDSGIVVIKAENMQQKALLLGRNRQNLNGLKNVVGKFFDNDIIVE